MSLVRKHALLGRAAAATFLTAKLFNTRTLGVRAFFPLCFNFVEQERASQEAIQSLLTCSLTFHL